MFLPQQTRALALTATQLIGMAGAATAARPTETRTAMRAVAAIHSAHLRQQTPARPVSVSYWFLYAVWRLLASMHVLFPFAPLSLSRVMFTHVVDVNSH